MDGHKPPFVKTAWTLLIMLVLGVAYLQTLSEQRESDVKDDPAGLVIVQIQAKILLGVAALTDADQVMRQQEAQVLDAGTVDQRQRYMAFMIALGDPETAKQAALRMQADVAERQEALTKQQSQTQEMLDILASGGTLPSDHTSLASTLGWFGEFLEADENERDEIIAQARRTTIVVGGIGSGILLAAMVGFILLLVFIVKGFGGSLRSNMVSPASHHGLYVEVFVVWLFVFLLFTILASLVAQTIAEGNATVAMLFTLCAFFGSLSALLWARVRGVAWSQMQRDIGWHRGAGICKELLWGVVGYATTLPILGIGVLLTMLLFAIQSAFSHGDPLGGTGGGSHPIIVDIAEGGWQVRILLLVLASIAAPIVEETMFRGVLYRQLRSVSPRANLFLSIAGSVFLTSFLFAAIHPQGWVAIPALMGIAIGMNLMREWRGTILPSMVVHGVSNGLVMTMVLVLLS